MLYPNFSTLNLLKIKELYFCHVLRSKSLNDGNFSIKSCLCSRRYGSARLAKFTQGFLLRKITSFRDDAFLMAKIGRVFYLLRQHFLYFFPLPQGHGAFLPISGSFFI